MILLLIFYIAGSVTGLILFKSFYKKYTGHWSKQDHAAIAPILFLSWGIVLFILIDILEQRKKGTLL